MRQFVDVLAQPDAGEKIKSEGARRLRLLAVNLNRRFHHVLDRAEMLEQIEVLEHHADLRVGASLGQIARWPHHVVAALIADIFTFDGDLAPVEGFEVIDEPQ